MDDTQNDTADNQGADGSTINPARPTPEELARFAASVLHARPLPYDARLQLDNFKDFVAEHLRVEAGEAYDPLDGTTAPVYVDDRGVHPVPPSIFDAYRQKPVRRTGVAELTTLDSFIDYVNRYKAEGTEEPYQTVIFAKDDRRDPRLVAVFNHHAEGGDNEDAAFGDHRALHRFPLSDEWKVWTSKDGLKMSMLEFAAFMEDRIVDVIHPDQVQLTDVQQRFLAATNGQLASPDLLLKVSVSLKINETNHVREARNLSSGDAQIEFTNETSTEVKGDLVTVPGNFAIALPVFNGAEHADILLARLRYHREGGGVKFRYDLWRADRVFDQAFSDSLEKVLNLTGGPLFRGTDEHARARSE